MQHPRVLYGTLIVCTLLIAVYYSLVMLNYVHTLRICQPLIFPSDFTANATCTLMEATQQNWGTSANCSAQLESYGSLCAVYYDGYTCQCRPVSMPIVVGLSMGVVLTAISLLGTAVRSIARSLASVHRLFVVAVGFAHVPVHWPRLPHFAHLRLLRDLLAQHHREPASDLGASRSALCFVRVLLFCFVSEPGLLFVAAELAFVVGLSTVFSFYALTFIRRNR